ncbi:DegT/DnrJ/EryC1/StrS family aminotransferase [Halobacteriovorax sp. XZX-3]|uniref:DegT/DnrJ/EryC1/StrS aminotransferase family protein n=1 Tax=unclassified Halobacteriovorax TaxID=2639665 RepID=UPI00371D4A5C
MNNKINVVKPYLPNKKSFLNRVEKILENSVYTNNGPYVNELEEKLCDYLNVKNVVLVNNGTSALSLLYKALNLKGNVLTTPFSFVATTSSLLWEGLTPYFLDISPRDFNMDFSSIYTQDIPDISCILPVHVFGHPCDVFKIDKFAKEKNAKVIYDAAHCFGVKKSDNSILNYGDASILSFHATKLFQCIEGGAIVTNDDSLAEEIRSLRSFSINRKGEITGVGINAKMNEFSAAMGLSQLEVVDQAIKERAIIYDHYYDCLSSKYYFPELDSDVEWNYSYTVILFEDEEILLSKLKELNEQNIYPRRYFYPSLDTLFKGDVLCDVSGSISKRVLSLPNYPGLEMCIVDTIIQILLR